MIAMDTLILVLFISSLGSVQQAASQDVEIRGPNVGEAQADLDGGSGGGGGGSLGGQSRTIYSQRHLSPHRMMHFGKRPANGLPPTLNTWLGYQDLMAPYQSRQATLQRRQQQNFQQQQNDYLPFQFSLELENGQTLRAVPEDTQILAPSFQLPIDKNLLYTFGAERSPAADQLTFRAMKNNINNNEDAKREQQLLHQLIQGQRQDSGETSQRLSKLMLDNDESKDEVNNGASSSSQERAQDNSNNNQEAMKRSMHSAARSNTLSLPKAYVSTLWYGRQGSMPALSLGAFNKKAEPKENFFMHFGRK